MMIVPPLFRILILGVALVALDSSHGGPMTIASSSADEIKFQIFELDDTANRTVRSEGTRRYLRSDIFGPSGLTGLLEKVFSTQRTRGIMITDEFSVGASVYPTTNVSGFGLSMHRHPPWYFALMPLRRDFSWEWFDQESDLVFSKRQGPGKVRASLVAKGDKFELASIEFLQDATFRLRSGYFIFSELKETHQMVIRAGSIVHLSP
jgi:hypothetical protein